MFQKWGLMFNLFKKKSSGNGNGGPDFSMVDSQVKADELFRKGELAKLFLMPLEFGGQDFGLNVVYVPAFAAEMKASIDSNVIKPLAAEGKISRYEATPQYQGNSFIPSAIKINASEPGEFTAVIRIWGEALNEAK